MFSVENSLQNVNVRKSASNVNNSDSTSTSIKPASKSQIEYNHSFKGKTITLVKGTDLSERKVSTSMYDLFGIKKPSSTKEKLDMDNIIPSIRIKEEKTEDNATHSNAADNLEVANKNNKSSAETGNQFKKTSKKNEPKVELIL